MKEAMHPGEFLKEAFMIPLSVNNESLSKAICVTPATVSRLINGKASVSVPMALKLSVAFGTTAQQWLNLQMQWDLNNSVVDLDSVTKLHLFK